MLGRSGTAALLGVLCFSAAGCFVTAGEGQLIHQDIDQLKVDLKAEKDAAAAERERIKQDSTQKTQELSTALETLNRAARKSGADLSVDLEKAQNDINQLRGTLEVIQHRLDQMDQQNGERDKKLEQLLAWMGSRQKAVDAAEHPAEKSAIYALALKKLEAGDPPRARELLLDFLSKFKGDALGPNAQYWLGETYYAEKRYNDAIVEFQKVLTEHKGSEKVPDALLKIGLSFQSQKDCDKALLFFDEVVASHKATPAARTAKERSAECRRKK